MATFVGLWERRYSILEDIVKANVDAETYRGSEFNAALRIQSWYRGCRIRAYVRCLHRCAVTVQRVYRGFQERKRYSRRLKEYLHERRAMYYYDMALKIQRAWRGYRVRKYVFDYRAYRRQLERVAQSNEAAVADVASYWQQQEEARLTAGEKSQELETLNEARRLHYMLSTASKDGIFRPLGKPLPIEVQMASVTFPREQKLQSGTSRRQSPKDERVKPHRHQRDTLHRDQKSTSPGDLRRSLGTELTTSEHSTEISGVLALTTKLRECCSGRKPSVLPPLISKPQGPFMTPEKVWQCRTRPLNPTLRLSTPFNSVEEARAQIKAKEWRERLIEDKFVPFSKRQLKHEPMLHTKTPFAVLPYGTMRFRDEDPSKNMSSEPFRTLIPTLEYFNP